MKLTTVMAYNFVFQNPAHCKLGERWQQCGDRMLKQFFICMIFVFSTACSSLTTNKDLTTVSDSAVKIKTNESKKDSVVSSLTHLRNTTRLFGDFILFLRPDSIRFDSYKKDQNSGIYETDSDFGVSIANSSDIILKNIKYKRIKVFISTDRYIIIKDCKTCPLTIDRDSINYGVIFSSKGKQIKTIYNSVHSGDYKQEIDEYFNIK